MKLKVNEDICIGCGACQAICDKVFEISDNGLATVIVDEISDEFKEDAIDAMEGCPVGAIVYDISSEE